ncbi:MAG: hypothetical protein ACRELB_11740 [Polyangiaceae bacterium]
MEALSARIDAADARAGRAAGLERELAERGRQLADLSAEAEEMRSAAEAGAIAAGQVEALALRADRAERALAASTPEHDRALERHAEELLRFEEALRERAQAVRALEGEVSRRERLVKELVATLEEQAHATLHTHGAAPVTPLHAPPPTASAAGPNGSPDPALLTALADDNARLQRSLDALALDLAHREAEAQSTAWTIQELERKLASGPAPAASASASPAAGEPRSELLDQLDALRRALTQEHEARVRAESGEELVRARAEIQRQSALLAQLGQPEAGAEELR